MFIQFREYTIPIPVKVFVISQYRAPCYKDRIMPDFIPAFQSSGSLYTPGYIIITIAGIIFPVFIRITGTARFYMCIFSSCISNVSFNLIIEIVDMVSVSKFYFKTLGQVAIKIFLRKCCSNNTRKRTGTCSQKSTSSSIKVFCCYAKKSIPGLRIYSDIERS